MKTLMTIIATVVLRQWWRDHMSQRAFAADYDLAVLYDEDWTQRDRLVWGFKALWWRRGCLVGRHPFMDLRYSDGGEDGPRGTTCQCCNVRLTLSDIVDYAAQEQEWQDSYAAMLLWQEQETKRFHEAVARGEAVQDAPESPLSVIQRRALHGAPLNCGACGAPIEHHNPGEYDDECTMDSEPGVRPLGGDERGPGDAWRSDFRNNGSCTDKEG